MTNPLMARLSTAKRRSHPVDDEVTSPGDNRPHHMTTGNLLPARVANERYRTLFYANRRPLISASANCRTAIACTRESPTIPEH